MYSGTRYEAIDHHEEYIFTHINDKDYPLLSELWVNFYKDPLIVFERSNIIIHELIALKVILSHVEEQKLVDRLLFFFSYSYLNKQNVRCVSD